MLEAEIVKGLNRANEALERVANRPQANQQQFSASTVFGGSNPYQSHNSGDWPIERLRRLGSAYDSASILESVYRKASGRTRLSGMGPALLRLASRSGQSDAMARAMASGMPADYDDDRFEAQYGFTSLAKAAAVGVPGYDYAQGRPMIQGERRKTALAEGSGQTGGYIVPPQFMNELLTIAAEDGFIEQRAKVIPMNSRTAMWPMLDITTAQSAGTTPYFGGILAQWQPEAATINETEPAFKQTEWVAWDLVLYTVSSNQLLADNGIGLDALLTQLFGQAVTWYKEFAYLQGAGAGSTMPLGIVNAPATITATHAAAAGYFTLMDAAFMLSKLQIRSWDDACWIMHQSVIPQLIQMIDVGSTTASKIGSQSAGSHLAWVTPFGDGKMGGAGMKLPNAFLNGLPLFFTEKLSSIQGTFPGSLTASTNSVMLVDWSKYVIGMRLDMQIDVSPHFLFRNNQLAWRVVARCDGKPWLNNAITDQSGFTISPFVLWGG